jgi:hypothetical protein
MFAGIGAVGRIGRPGLSGRKGMSLLSGMTLSLDFMQPGILDPRITFTRASSATYTDASNVIQAASTNAPRWDYANGVLRGLLIEDARTNLAWPSVPAGYSLSNVTLIPNSGIAPDGTNSFVKLADTTANAIHSAQFAAPGVPNAPYACSVYAKMGEVRYLQLILDDLGGGQPAFMTTYDLQTGVVTTDGGVANGRITSVGNGIYRCMMTGLVGPSTTQVRLGINNSIIPYPSFYDAVYPGVAGTGNYIWGVQLEQGTFPTSYIPTTSAAVTRAQDVPIIADVNTTPWLNNGPGSWLAEFVYFNPAPVNSRIIGTFNTAGGVTPIFLTATPINGAQYNGVAAINTTNAFANNTIAKVSSTWGAGIGKVCTNGGVVVSGALAFGYYSSLSGFGVALMVPMPGGNPDNTSGYLRRVLYWNRVLSDAEMQAVST